MSRSRASKLLARPPRSLNSARIPMKTQRVIITGRALGTTRVMIADSTVVATISAPTTKASTATTVVSTASLAPPPRAPHPLPPDPAQAPQPIQQSPPPLRTVRVRVAARGDAGLGQHHPNP